MTAASSAEGRSAAGAAASMPPHRGGQYDQFTGMPVSTGQRFADGPDIDRMTGDARSSPASGSAGATPASSAAPKPFIRDPFDAGRAPKPAEKAGAGRTGATEAPGGNHGTQGASKAAETQPAHTPGAPAPAGLPVASLARLSAVLTQAAEASSGHFQRADATTRPGGPVRILSITLEPADLGSVSVRLRARGESLEVALKAAQPQTARLLETDSGKLRGLIRDAGFIVDRLTVETAPSFDRASSSSAAGERGDAPSGGTNGGSSSGGGATGGGLAGNTRGDWGEGQPRGRDGRYRAAFVTARGETGEVAERGRADGPLYV